MADGTLQCKSLCLSITVLRWLSMELQMSSTDIVLLTTGTRLLLKASVSSRMELKSASLFFFFFFPNTDFHWDWFGLHCIQPAVSKDNIVSGSFRRGIAVVLVIRFGRVVRIKSRIASPFLGLSLI